MNVDRAGALSESAFQAALEDIRAAEAAGDTDFAQARRRVARALLDRLPEGIRAARAGLLDRALAPHARPPDRTGPDRTGPDRTWPDRAGPRGTPLGGIAAEGAPGVSLVTCAMNRTENLLGALGSWLGNPGIDEIVVVDWSSDDPVGPALAAAGLNDARLRVVRVEGEPRWILSYAFNAGFRLARHARILKVDADIVLSESFIAANPLAPGSFIAGNWRTADDDQAFVNGFFFAHRADLAAVGGFNEFITTYGWDDDDLYERLTAHGVRRVDVAPGSLRHQDHDDDARLGSGPGADIARHRSAAEEICADTAWWIRRNHHVAAMMPVWSGRRTPLPLAFEPGRADRLRRAGAPRHIVPRLIEAAAGERALAEIASWKLGPQVMTLQARARERLLARPLAEIGPEDIRAVAEAAEQETPAAPHVTLPRPRVFIDAQHGLGNRLRAIASAGAIAEATGRELVIVWQPDHHCEARLTDLFVPPCAVLEESFLAEASARGCAVYNYMEIEPGAEKDAALDLSRTGDIYARAAYVLNAPPSTWEAENRYLRALRPVPQVQALVDTVPGPFDLSMHVRMVGAAGTDTASYDRAENWTADGHAAINRWREQSHYARFMARLDALIADGSANRVFLAADAPETYAAFGKTYGARVAALGRARYDRSAEQLQYALADALLLGRAPRLLGSTWSSFSELAMRLSAGGMQVEMSGRDF